MAVRLDGRGGRSDLRRMSSSSRWHGETISIAGGGGGGCTAEVDAKV
jgi:hypothetical protein